MIIISVSLSLSFCVRAVGCPDVKNFSWERYLSETGSLPAPARAFKSVSVVILNLVMSCVFSWDASSSRSTETSSRFSGECEVGGGRPEESCSHSSGNGGGHRWPSTSGENHTFVLMKVMCVWSANLIRSERWVRGHASHDLCVVDLCRKSFWSVSEIHMSVWIRTAGLESVCQLSYNDHETLLLFYSHFWALKI